MERKKRMNVKCYSLEASGTLKGIIKNGLDSSTIINLIIAYATKF